MVQTHVTSGRALPSWDQFKEASRHGQVRAKQSVAFTVIWWRGMPRRYAIFYGVFQALSSLLAVPATLALYILTGISAWWIVASALAAAYLLVATREGVCAAVIAGAEQDETLYRALALRGAFLFKPT